MMHNLSCRLLMIGYLAVIATDMRAAEKAAPQTPASVADALKVFDPEKFPVPEGAEINHRSVGGVSYRAGGKVQPLFELNQRALAKLNWKELPNSYLSDMACSGTFSQAGFLLTLSTSPVGPEDVLISLQNHGNVDLKKLPIPPGTKPFYGLPTNESYLTEADRDQTAAAVAKLLQAQGWTPYGSAGDLLYFKQRAVRLGANIATAPAQGNKTVITYMSEQLSADIPAPPETIGLQYSDATKRLFFDIAADEPTVHKFYNAGLEKDGWKPTLEKPLKIGFKGTVIYRNPAKDMLTLEMSEFEGKLRVELIHQSAAEVEAVEARIQAELEAKKKAAKMQRPKPGTLKVSLPKEAENIEREAAEIKFTIAGGKAKLFAESLRKQLKADGWKEKTSMLDAMFGLVMLEQGKQQLQIMYVDTGIMPAEVTLSGDGVELEAGSAK